MRCIGDQPECLEGRSAQEILALPTEDDAAGSHVVLDMELCLTNRKPGPSTVGERKVPVAGVPNDQLLAR